MAPEGHERVRAGPEQLQVARVVVASVAVHVMHVLAPLQPPVQQNAHHQPVQPEPLVADSNLLVTRALSRALPGSGQQAGHYSLTLTEASRCGPR